MVLGYHSFSMGCNKPDIVRSKFLMIDLSIIEFSNIVSVATRDWYQICKNNLDGVYFQFPTDGGTLSILQACQFRYSEYAISSGSVLFLI